ncbi:DEAD/DEAH box helicase [bacterium]|nr:MAG: DEAD/DEAH box helicase [bacterium]QQR61466.1 MAG: DEAD/DEAH box helicase [bacterium]QQR63008.1 MAG: DEAD/DEAH box helicase [bacterium]
MSQFSTFGLAPHLLAALQKAGIITPTPVQAETIQPACEGRDVLATAQTGTGKTFAYLLPLLTRIDADKNQMGLILVPTRELAIQVKAAINQLCSRTHAKVALLIGGEPMFKQLRVLRSKPFIVVGTPGRVMDHLERQTLNLEGCSFFVLDEVDRMLDMGFSQQLNIVRKALPKNIQTLMFSATMPKDIAGLAEQYLSNPHRITLGSVHQPVVNVKQDIVHTQENEKFDCLLKELELREGSVIIFVKTKKGADILAKKLKLKFHEAEAIHGDLRQQKRVLIVEQFRKKINRIMVATDIAARGIDVPHVQHVVNYDLPQSPEDYVHRIGRTGRAGNQGFAVSLIVPSENRQWVNIQRFLQGKTYSSNLRIEGIEQRPRSNDRFNDRRDYGNRRNFSRSRSASFSDRRDSFKDRRDRSNNDSYNQNGFENYKSSEGFEGGDNRRGGYSSDFKAEKRFHDKPNGGFHRMNRDTRLHNASDFQKGPRRQHNVTGENSGEKSEYRRRAWRDDHASSSRSGFKRGSRPQQHRISTSI